MAKSTGFPQDFSPRKAIAMGKATSVSEPGDNFGVSSTLGGCGSHPHMDSPANGRGISHKPMPEAKRNPLVPGRGKKSPNQRHPDHGPHNSY